MKPSREILGSVVAAVLVGGSSAYLLGRAFLAWCRPTAATSDTMIQDFNMLDRDDQAVFCDVLSLRVSRDLNEHDLRETEARIECLLEESRSNLSLLGVLKRPF